MILKLVTLISSCNNLRLLFRFQILSLTTFHKCIIMLFLILISILCSYNDSSIRLQAKEFIHSYTRGIYIIKNTKAMISYSVAKERSIFKFNSRLECFYIFYLILFINPIFISV